MTISKKLVATSVLAIMMSLVMAPSVKVYAIEGSTQSVAEPTAGELTEEEIITEGADALDSFTKEELIKFTEGLMKSDENAEVKFTTGDDYALAEVAFEDVGEFAKIAKEDSQYIDSWNYVVDSMRQVTEVYAPYYQKFGMDFSICVVDDKNPGTALIYCKNGEVIYDCVNNIGSESDIIR